MILRGDDVAGDERRHEREEPHRREEEQDERDREARLAHVAAERHVVGRAALKRERVTKISGTAIDRPEAEIGSLLRHELSELPAVSREEGRHHATSSTTGSAGGATAAEAPSCSVSWKKSCSSVACCGTSARTPMPAPAELRHEPLDQLLDRREPHLARPPGEVAQPETRPPRLRRRRGRRRAAGRQAPSDRVRLGHVALVQDPAAVDDRHAVAQLLDVGHLVAREQHGHALRGEPPDAASRMSRIPAGSRPVCRLVEDQQARVAEQRRRDPEPLAHAVGVAADPVAGTVGQVDVVEHLVDPRRRVAAVVGRAQLAGSCAPVRYG